MKNHTMKDHMMKDQSQCLSLIVSLFVISLSSLFSMAVANAAPSNDPDAGDRAPEMKSLLPGVKMTLVAEHPQLVTPTGVDVDKQGRIWVVATHTHFPPDDYDGPKHDEILIFSDKNGDGKAEHRQAEHRQVFYNKTIKTMDLELGEDGWVYLIERSRVLRIKDTDGDGKADVEETLLTLKTKTIYPHNGLEGLTWHPNGDLMCGIGENFGKPWTLTGADGSHVSGTGEGGIFRFTAKGKKLRRIARGFWNPFGICVRKDGQIFAAENDPAELPPCRLLHVVEGGEYGYQKTYGHAAHHPFVAWNGELRGTLPMVHPTGEAPCGILPLGNGLLVPAWGDHRIDFLPLQKKGATYTSKTVTIAKGGRYFRPTCIAESPKSTKAKRTYYLADWVDGRYASHGFGRLWKLEVDLEKAKWVGKLELEPLTGNAKIAANLRNGVASNNTEKSTEKSTEELFKYATNEDAFLSRAALIALARKAPQWTLQDVRNVPEAQRAYAVLALRIANTSPKKWIKPLLADKNSGVQFEALHWIADDRLKQFLPDVEKTLRRSDLDFTQFEAAIATWNVLKGDSQKGVRNLDMLLERVQDTKSPPQIRAYALRMLPAQPHHASKKDAPPVQDFPKGLTLGLLQKLLAVNHEGLSLEVLRTLAGNPIVSQKLLAKIAGDTKQSSSLRAEAVAGLVSVTDRYTALLLKLAGDNQTAVREEALRCLRVGKRTPEELETLKKLAMQFPQSVDLYRAILNPKSLTEGRPDLTDTEAWDKALKAIKTPVDNESGRRLFYNTRLSLCSNCHRHSGRGNVVGPDLSALGNRNNSTWLLQSILEPSREMAPEYLPRTIVLKNGKTFTGIRLQSYTREAIRDAHGQKRSFNRSDILLMKESSVSFMPKGLPNALTDRELRDLIAFLESKTK